jgi:copper chaperone
MNTETVTVSGMTCGHCVSSVREEIGKIAGVMDVDVDLASGKVVIKADVPLDAATIKGAVEEAGYQLAG